MKKNISRNPLWPDWYNGKKIDEVQFGRAFLEQWPLKCVNGTLYTLDGPVEDESEIKQRILENIEEYVTSGLSKKVTNILETIKLLAFSDPFPIEQDCIHLQNGVYHLPDGSFQESRLFCQNRLPVRYDPKAASPDRWLTFLHELLDDADIPTLQEYLGYCLIPSTKGQKMMLIVGKGGEGKFAPVFPESRHGWPECPAPYVPLPPACPRPLPAPLPTGAYLRCRLLAGT